MAVSISNNQKGVSFALIGRVSLNDAAALLRHLVVNMDKEVTVDMAEVITCDVLAFKVLRSVYNTTCRYGGTLNVVNIHEDDLDKFVMCMNSSEYSKW